MTEFKFEPYDGPQRENLVRDMPLYTNLINILPANTRMPDIYKDYHKQYQDFASKPTDHWVLSYPKAGTTWTQELVWCVMFGLDNPRTSEILTKRFPFFEWDSLFPEGFELTDLPDDDPNKAGNMWRALNEELPEPRTIKSHLHRGLLPADVDTVKPKIVYVCRDPRDLCISLYYHSIKLDGYTGSFEDFVDIFLGDALPWSPFWSHVRSFWEIRHKKNVLFLCFEELKKDMKTSLKKVASFLEIKRGDKVGELTDEEIKLLEEHLDFKSMSKNPAVNNEILVSAAVASTADNKDMKFMRKGIVGDHKNHLTAEHLSRFKKWTEEGLKGSDFPYYRNYD